MLYIVATPIGNLEDITLRALETLKKVDAIICEDTRRTGLLLSHYKIQKPKVVLNDYNEAKTLFFILERLKSGENLALISDAGTPLISDPGYKLVRECIRNGIPVDSIPGPSSVIISLTLSALPPDKFMFLGYPPEKHTQRLKLFHYILDREHNEILKATYIMFVSPYKLLRTLEDLKEIFGNTEIVLAKELTKIHQKVESKKITEWIKELNSGGPKGEYTLLFNLTSP